MRTAFVTGISLAVLTSACASDEGGPGNLRIKLVAEETIVDGLEVGADEENTRDYKVTYSKYVAAVGRVKVAKTSSSEARNDPNVYIADLRQVGTTGVDVTTFTDLPSGQWDQFGYESPIAGPGAVKLGTISDADVQAMIDQQLTYWIEGTVESTPPVRFEIKVGIGSVYSACESDGEPGVSVGEGRTSTAELTLHGDHLWFDTLVRGDETTVNRRAAWMVKADKDGDGKVTTEDLKTVRAEEVFLTSDGYNLSGGVVPVVTAYDFVRAQLASQGHLNGEGECDSPPL